MSRRIRQKYSGKVLQVLREDEDWLVITNPDHPGSQFLISRLHYEQKWEPAEPLSKKRPTIVKQVVPLSDNEQPVKRGRGRPKGSKNKVKPKP